MDFSLLVCHSPNWSCKIAASPARQDVSDLPAVEVEVTSLMHISIVDLRLGCRLKRDAVLFVELDAVVPLWGFEQHCAECSAMHDAIATISGGKLQRIEVVPPDHIVSLLTSCVRSG
ncbi:hypothetical protein [Rhizobium pisi]|uniref:hypothetical protein n=1 Tax=Rhizobium pisi TaxID=574561 RepID=UPI0013F1581F|nr:hypothetical protein [Rhizobium pisi]